MIRKTTKGFTLIELLVVIAIIALLLSIIMPALGKVKAGAKKTVCATNIRQNGQAFNLYASDNDGELYVAPSTSNVPTWASFYSWGGITMDFDYLYLPSRYNISTKPYERALNIYLPTETPVYVCPSDPSGDTKLWAPFGVTVNDSTQAYYTSTGTSYQYNAFLVLEDYSGYKRMSNVPSSGTTILINEWPAYDVLGNFYRPANWTDKPRWSFHDDSGRGLEPDVEDGSGVGNDAYDEYGNNTAFVDGHVEYIDYDVSQVRGSGYSWYEE